MHPLLSMCFVFNLIVGTGCLALPKAFSEAGWILGGAVIIIIGVMGYASATFVIEAMSNANAVECWLELQRQRKEKKNHAPAALTNHQLADLYSEDTPIMDTEDDADRKFLLSIRSLTSPLNGARSAGRGPKRGKLPLFNIDKRIEMGEMASMFFNTVGIILFYVCICIYLYGDLAIYATAVPKSLRNTVCSYQPKDHEAACGNKTTVPTQWPCFSEATPSLTRELMYRIFVVAFILLLGPFVFFNVTKTVWLQVATTVVRWSAFLTMIILSITWLFEGKARGAPAKFNIHGLPAIFGVSIYSFMCHHSLPSLITPIERKNKLSLLMLGDYVLVGVFYLFLATTSVFTFEKVEDLITLNFLPDPCRPDAPHTPIVFLQKYLALFPVFTISSSFPIICITLRNNIRAVILLALKSIQARRERNRAVRGQSTLPSSGAASSSSPVATASGRRHSSLAAAVAPQLDPSVNVAPASGRLLQWFLRFGVPIVVVIPPLCIALITDNVAFLAGFTGTYSGAFVQYVFPAFLVFYSRRDKRLQLARNEISSRMLSKAEATVDGNAHGQPSNAAAHVVNDDSPSVSPTLKRRSPTGGHTNYAAVAESDDDDDVQDFSTVPVRGESSAGNNNHSAAVVVMPRHHQHTSPFSHTFWVVLINVWALLCIVLVTVDRFVV